MIITVTLTGTDALTHTCFTYASGNKWGAQTHQHTHAPPPPLPGVLIWHSIYTHIYSVYSLLYEADRYLSATLLRGARASWRCNQTVHSLRALSHCSFNNGLWEMHKEWAACSRESGQAGAGDQDTFKMALNTWWKDAACQGSVAQHEEEEELDAYLLQLSACSFSPHPASEINSALKFVWVLS